MSNSDHVKRQLSRYKELLANLSRRNRELYYREVKGSSINLSRQPFSKSSFKDVAVPQFEPLKFSSEKFRSILKGNSLDLFEHFQIHEVKDAEVVNKFCKKLEKTRTVDDQHQREFGISGAWVLGPFLCWRTSASSPREDLLITPIFKLPVDLERNKKKHLNLKAEEDSLSFNPSLQICLKHNLGVELEEGISFESFDEGMEYLRKQLEKESKTICELPSKLDFVPRMPSRFKITRDEDGVEIERKPVNIDDVLTAIELEVFNSATFDQFILIDVLYLDQLKASRTVLISDYDRILEEEIDHPVLIELFNGVLLSDEKIGDRSKLRELDSYREKDNHFVIDIDSTQHRAIDRATKSQAIVIQGPPGSGKSQTIVNLIADYLSKGKKVLFVSDKRPALDVVFNRMKSASIESQAVLIHSSDLNKSDLYKSFLQLADSEPSEIDERERESTSSNLDRTKSDINIYAQNLAETHKDSFLSSADILFLSSKTNRLLFNQEVYLFFRKFDFDALGRIGYDLDGIQSLLNPLREYENSPWIHKRDSVIRSISMEHKLRAIEEKIRKSLEKKTALELQLFQMIGCIPNSETMSLIRSMPHMERIGEEHGLLWKNFGSISSRKLTETVDLLKELASKLESCVRFFSSIDPDTSLETIDDLAEYYKFQRGFSDWFSSAYWSRRKLRMKACPSWDGTARQFEGYKEYRETFKRVSEVLTNLQSGLSISLNEHESTVDLLTEKIKFLNLISKIIEDASIKLPPKMYSEMTKSLTAFNDTLRQIEEVESLNSEMKMTDHEAATAWGNISEFLEVYPAFSSHQTCLSYISLMLDQLPVLDVLDKVDIQVRAAENQHKFTGLRTAIFESFARTDVAWSEVLKASVYNGWSDEILSKFSSLRSFDRSQKFANGVEFAKSVDIHKLTSRQAVHQAFAKRWISSSDRSGVPLLKKESTKQRKVLSPREIMERGALNTMLQLKPCWLMSPLSISQMLPLHKGLFDVIIFDEASQVRVEDAVPSIYRAKSMIVVGDNKQMPPTSFFSGGMIDDETDDDEEEISPSVLDLAIQVYPSVLLEWHYRSRAESLIAFSNRAFYGGRLIAAPNPQVLTSNGALHHVEVSDAYFTSKSGNVKEAEAVINKLVELLLQNSNRSFGIIAMGQSQAIALEEALERKCCDDSNVRTLIDKALNYKDGDADAGLFMKNLENVQGDERDIVLLSVGYAPAGEGKKLKMQFGPLSQKGGGRRLNVAITRAKCQMYVFTSFSPSQIATDDETFNRNPDLCVLGRYLKYVNAVSTGNLEAAIGILDSFGMAGAITGRKSSRFALDVKRRLEEIGYQVSAEIGTSGFFIDLGIHHPNLPSNFLVGIECDGAIFHSTPYARDRDKIRESLLKARGWRIERVWSQDWSRDWHKELSRLDEKIKSLISEFQVKDRPKAVGE